MPQFVCSLLVTVTALFSGQILQALEPESDAVFVRVIDVGGPEKGLD